ncbi:MAG: DUF4340 domain-containing protein [Gemmatimonadetes bacterium]|uniref:DUF4340 domain-containing protein n=1 Tax=Candidatus Kutchimonas denitrificans TaxID=3056748 RepID=A0AAE4ZDI1_9BACT|nr:DUF4340 domain-containing protein [Gemmatimonadota bacterium]NIR76420.1 DUF4340 domain-containing protein [Candidatus Kutchimonas denitrificans]NIS03239.1 DUF4340 domain-containing protein [Gemmatimonadota bacterium]NIT69100.1 DUF4340 domain-containing protein [Gemmatimonadota bacterium]NIU54492.1 DUF4340 domain-containing protein [Gemmatimonadota bacterium]
MSDRLLRLLVGVLIFFVIAWVAARFFTGDGASASGSFGLAAVAGGSIDSVVVTSADDTVRLRAGDPWTVNGHEALPETGSMLTRGLEESQVGQLVSRNPENHARMGVTDAAGRRLTVYPENGEPISIIVGERAGAFNQSYARRVGADEVYVLEGSLSNLANREEDDWRDREIFAVERAGVQRVEFTYPGESFALVRDSAGWRLEPSGAGARAGDVSNLLGQLTALRAIGFADDSAAAALAWDEPAARVGVIGPDDAELVELLFQENEDVGYFVRRAGSSVVYTLSSYTGNVILRRETALATASDG